MPEQTREKSPLELLLGSTVVAAIVTAILGTLITNYILQRLKENSLEVQRIRQREQALVDRQLEVLERLDAVVEDYRTAAEFVIYDIVDREGELLIEPSARDRGLERYDVAAARFISEARKEVFRARLCFDEPELTGTLQARIDDLIRVEGSIAKAAAGFRPTKGAADETDQKLRNEASQKLLAESRDDLRHSYDAVLKQLSAMSDRTIAKRSHGKPASKGILLSPAKSRPQGPLPLDRREVAPAPPR